MTTPVDALDTLDAAAVGSADGPPDLATLLAAGERAVFHGAPGSAVSALEQAVGLAQREGRHAEVAAAAWLLGVALSASGRYGGGLAVLIPVLETAETSDEASVRPEIRLFGSLAAATAASVHRGLGRHAEAAVLDTRGLTLAEGSEEAVFDCVLGLTVDAIGAAEAEAARSWIAKATLLVEGHGGDWWRQQVRLSWARAELALLDDSPADAIGWAARAVEGAEAARAPRHVAKGLLFYGVAELQSGASEGIATLRRAATLAEGLGTVPLIWQARALLGVLLGGEETEEGKRSLATARSAVLTIAGDLPVALREAWLAQPNVSAVLGG
ncbi:MAG TPA: hypothetical protein VMH41_05105 [Mycobacteriales bacterium]|nr:hypothetical protein [Mycobacteriales bacterium]